MNRRKAHRKRFYQRKGFWFVLMLLAILSATGAVLGYRYLDAYTQRFRIRADGYDLERINEVEVPSLIVDRNGKEIGRFFVQNRSMIPIREVPKVFLQALYAGEDQRFETHDGVDYIGIVRALYLNWKAGETTQGASTITQQLARNAYDLNRERKRYGESDKERKIVEMFLARRIEKRYSKAEILEFYLNRIYFGSGYYGIRSAALGYFGKEPSGLSAMESAAIVGTIKNPRYQSPLNYPENNRRSRNLVLGRMVELGSLRKREAAQLAGAPLPLNPKPLRRDTTHLYERVSEAVREALGDDILTAGGLTIHTTILAEAQEAAQKSLLDSLTRAESRPGYRRPKYADYSKASGKTAEYLQGAVLMVDHESGEVLAHVGGRDYAQVPYDFIESGKRPLGTAFFPFIYAAGLDTGTVTPASLVEDEPMDNRSVMVGGREGILGEWGMEVASPVYQGKIPVRVALEQSKIAATVRFADQLGLGRVIRSACAFGLPLQKAERLRRLSVGFEEVSMRQAVRAMAAFPAGGRLGAEHPVYVVRVDDPAGQPIYQYQRRLEERPQVIDGATAWQVHSMMAGSLYRGSSKGVLDGLLEKPFNGAGKGGTCHDFNDCWFLGYNQRVTCGVWTGFLSANGEPIYPGAFSRDLAMPVWQAVMNAATPSFGGGRLEPPSNVTELQVCRVSGQRTTQFCQEYIETPGSAGVYSRSTGVAEYFRRGTEGIPFCTVHSGSDGDAEGITALQLPALDVVPVRAKGPALLGDDPYHTELPNFGNNTAEPGAIRRRTNVLDSLDLGDVEESLPLRGPQRLQLTDD